MINRSRDGRRAWPAVLDRDSARADVPGVVTNTGTQRYSRRRFMGGAVGVAALGSFAVACGGVERLAPSAAPVTATGSPLSIASASPGIAGATAGVDAELVSRRYLGLKPFAPAPPPPAVKPVTLSAADPTVFSRVPLTDNVVFVTIDDGIEKDPRFIQMVRDFQVPQVTDMQYQTSAHRLSPGDIILCHFRGPAQLHGESMVHMMIHLFRRIQAQGFTVADITQYV